MVPPVLLSNVGLGEDGGFGQRGQQRDVRSLETGNASAFRGTRPGDAPRLTHAFAASALHTRRFDPGHFGHVVDRILGRELRRARTGFPVRSKVENARKKKKHLLAQRDVRHGRLKQGTQMHRRGAKSLSSEEMKTLGIAVSCVVVAIVLIVRFGRGAGSGAASKRARTTPERVGPDEGAMTPEDAALNETKERTLTLPLGTQSSAVDLRTKHPPPALRDAALPSERPEQHVERETLLAMHRDQKRHSPPARFDQGAFPLRKERGVGDKSDEQG